MLVHATVDQLHIVYYYIRTVREFHVIVNLGGNVHVSHILVLSMHTAIVYVYVDK